MTTTRSTTPRTTTKAAGRKFGYVLMIAINAAGLVVVNNLLAWNWFHFLTNDFTRVVGIITASMVVSLVANLVYLANDAPGVRLLGQMAVTALSIAASVRVYQVFPFDFTPYSFDWALVARILLILGIVGAAMGLIAEFTKAARGIAEY